MAHHTHAENHLKLAILSDPLGGNLPGKFSILANRAMADWALGPISRNPLNWRLQWILFVLDGFGVVPELNKHIRFIQDENR